MTNRLRNETSPYLLQHADNPVDWHAWNEEALALARESGKPVLLSIGYSACHWCHVMAHESFEDAATAEVMNRLYVNIKVDREERPDIDRIYQIAHQLFTGRGGGWPLTVFLTPDSHLPIFVGTYFPREQRYGMPSFIEVLERVEAFYRERPDDIAKQGNALLDAFRRIDGPPPEDESAPRDPAIRDAAARGPATLGPAPLDGARAALAASFDGRHGGFGAAPKFPRAAALELLLELWHDSRKAAGGEDHQALHIVSHTLTAMARGGLYDQLGGGFFRYSVDEAWAIPHFEKMLYDNASLLALYADAYAATGDAAFAAIASETADWMNRDMLDADGGYYATLDADSEGEEGRFYLWTPGEVDALLDPPESPVAKTVLGLLRPANFEGRHWHLHRAESLSTVADASGADPGEVERLFASARRKLLSARNARIWPGRDEKQLAGWNGLAIRAMARAARRLDRRDLADTAANAVQFVRARLWDGQRLKAAYKDGRARFPAYLDDYAFLADGLLELLQYRWRTEDLIFARELIDVLLTRFEDARGGFYFVADDHERLIHRPKSFADEAVPSGNGVALSVLQVLGHLLGETAYLDAAERGLRAAWRLIEQHPDPHATMLQALSLRLKPPQLTVVRGAPAELDRWRSGIDRSYQPRRLNYFIPDDVADLPGLLAQRSALPGGPVAYVCEGTQCRAPIRDRQQLIAALAIPSGPGG